MISKGFGKEFNWFPKVCQGIWSISKDWVRNVTNFEINFQGFEKPKLINFQKNSEGFVWVRMWFIFVGFSKGSKQFVQDWVRNLIDSDRNFKGFGKEFDPFPKDF